MTIAKNWLRAQGLSCLSEYIHQRRRIDALKAGWPGARSRQEVKILEALVSGPQTAKELAGKLGRSQSNVLRMLASMRDRGGLVAIAGQQPSGHGRPSDVYQIVQNHPKLLQKE